MARVRRERYDALMTRGQLRRAFVAAAGAVTVAAASTVPMAACGDPYAESASPIADAAPESAADTSPAATNADPCPRALPAAMPEIDDAPGEELPTFFVAVRSSALLDEGGNAPGFDLDGVCTCDPRPFTRYDAAASCIATGPRCDLDGGVDNAVSALVAQLSPFYDFDGVPKRLIQVGRRTLMVQIGKYNGRANDKEVAIGLALSEGIRERGCDASVLDTTKGIYSPGWCGDDHWSFAPESLLPTTKQPLIQGVGYVRDGVLTVQLAGKLLAPFNEVSVLPIGSPVIAGTLVPLREDLTPRDRATPPTEREKRLWTITNGTVAGRLKSSDLLSAIGTIEIPRKPSGSGSDYLCTQSQFVFAKEQICGSPDVTSSKSLDFDPRAECDALSVGLAFTAFAALPGERYTSSPDPNPCVPGADGQPGDASVGSVPYTCPKTK